MKTGQLYQKYRDWASAWILRKKPYRSVEKAPSKGINKSKV